MCSLNYIKLTQILVEGFLKNESLRIPKDPKECSVYLPCSTSERNLKYQNIV